VAGTVTNCLNFVVLSRREMRSVSTSVYLFALLVATWRIRWNDACSSTSVYLFAHIDATWRIRWNDLCVVGTSVYLFALAVADLGVMYLELFRIWFEWAQVGLLFALPA